MKVSITIDQAVWERSEFTVEVEDGLTGEALTEAIEQAVDNYDEWGTDGCKQSTLDEPVYGINLDKKATLETGTELAF